MIISDAHQLAFVHIPKCGGTAVRARLAPLDDTGGAFTRRVDTHPELGRIDYVHIPLFILADHFPDTYEKVLRYATYAVVRDPYDRFPSSLAQHLRMYGGRAMHELSVRELRRSMDEVMRGLARHRSNGRYLPHQYIHFQPQVDYVRHGGRTAIDFLYDVGDVDILIEDIGARVGQPLPEDPAGPAERSNASMVYRSDAARILMQALRPLARAALPRRVLDPLEARMSAALRVPRQKRFEHLFLSEHVRDFVGDYYADDLELFATITSPRTGGRE